MLLCYLPDRKNNLKFNNLLMVSNNLIIILQGANDKNSTKYILSLLFDDGTNKSRNVCDFNII